MTTRQFNYRAIFLTFLLIATACSQKYALNPSTLKITPATSQDVMKAVKTADAKVVLVNMWASWCGPCQEEFPGLVKVQQEFATQDLKVVFVSWDDTGADATRFLAKQGVSTPTFLKNEHQSDQDFIAGININWTGALPATLIYDGKGNLLQFWEESVDYKTFKEAVQKALKQG